MTRPDSSETLEKRKTKPSSWLANKWHDWISPFRTDITFSFAIWSALFIAGYNKADNKLCSLRVAQKELKFDSLLTLILHCSMLLPSHRQWFSHSCNFNDWKLCCLILIWAGIRLPSVYIFGGKHESQTSSWFRNPLVSTRNGVNIYKNWEEDE